MKLNLDWHAKFTTYPYQALGTDGKAHALQKIARRQYLDGLKSVPCKDCGVAYPPYVMDFDHIRGRKVRGIGKMLTSSWSTLQAEIAKCEIVCSNCHRERTHQRALKNFPVLAKRALKTKGILD